jgi:hypothetical protein
MNIPVGVATLFGCGARTSDVLIASAYSLKGSDEAGWACVETVDEHADGARQCTYYESGTRASLHKTDVEFPLRQRHSESDSCLQLEDERWGVDGGSMGGTRTV